MTQLPLFAPVSDWKPPSISELPSWKDARRIAIDCETKDPHLTVLGPGVRRNDSYMVGMSFAIEDGPAHYLPIRHASGGNLPVESVLGYLKEQAKVFKGDLVGANLPYDIDFLAEEGVTFNPRFWRDIQVAAPLLWELHNSYSMQAIAEREGIPGKDMTMLNYAAEAYGISPRAELWKMHSKYVGAYGEQDVRLPLQILARQERQIDDQDLWDIFDLESQVLPVLVKMRRRGVRIDFDKLEQIENWSLEEETKVLKEIKRQTSINIEVGDVWRAGQLAKVLESIGVEVTLTPKTGKPSVTSALLDSIDHEIAGLIRRARKVNKLRTTFAKSVRNHETNGRIHCTFNQLRRSKEESNDQSSGGRFGRLSSSDPNLQQQPGKKDPEMGLLWRQVYVPEEGSLWACLDFSQQEPRWAVHYAEELECVRATSAGDRYREDPRTDTHAMMADLTGLPREQAKQIFLGLLYGMGGGKLCRKLGLPTEWVPSSRLGKMIEVAGPEGSSIIERFHREVPFISELSSSCSKAAEERGWVRTILGRVCHFPKKEDGSYDWIHTALNRVIQGSSADQTKKAMVLGDAAGFDLQLQVHDELDLSVQDIEKAKELAEIMVTSVKCRVPHKVGADVGPSWGEVG